jgi:Uma2 family endonuclease
MEDRMVDRYTAHMPAGTTRRLLTTADYHSMIEAGILGPEDRVELLAGEIYEAAAVGSPHAACVVRLNEWFFTRVGNRALVSVQNPVELSTLSEPEPDLMLLERRENFYADRHPGPADVLLLIEVAASSYEYDRNLKLPLYAEAGIREVWLIALEQQAVEVYRDPSAGSYRWAESRRAGDSLGPVAFPDLELGVSELFG